MLWSNQVLNKCTIIRIDDLFPRGVYLSEVHYGFDNIFMLLIRENGIYTLYKDIGYTMSEAEMVHFNNTLEMWDKDFVSFKNNSIVQIILPESFQDFIDGINNIGGARISPAVLILEGNMYLQIEFDESVNFEVSRKILDIRRTMNSFTITPVYYGKQSEESTFLFTMYLENEDKSSNMQVVCTKWQITTEERVEQNMGVFQNAGFFLPKYFGNENGVVLLFRGNEAEMLGDFDYKLINKKTNLFEVYVKSNFMKDFYRDVIEQYYGATFFMLEVNHSEVICYYIVEKNLISNFYAGIERHWQEVSRNKHSNFVDSVKDLNEIVKLGTVKDI